ncbi:MAG: S8 family serine peptidase [Proteobacteria bacterium]|nr:S8 family serine peptidase [Pseudomonadota bacterium]
MLLLLASLCLAADVAVFVEEVPDDARLALGPQAAGVEQATGVRLSHWVVLDELDVPTGAKWTRLGAPVAPPFERHDYLPQTPAFDQDWLAPVPFGLGAQKLWSWPGGTGLHVVLADVEYDYDAFHEDLRGNLPTVTGGEPLGEFAYHGNASIGIAAAARDGFGTSGAAPDAAVLVAYPMYGGQWNPARAVVDASATLRPGDVLLIEQQTQPDGQFAPVSANPMIADALEAAVLLGLVVIEPMGNGGRDVDPLDLPSIGTLRVGGEEPRTKAALISSNYGAAADVRGWAAAIPSPTTDAYTPDLFFPEDDPQQAYTSQFGGTSGASAQVAGVCAQIQSIATAVYGEPLPPAIVRQGLMQTGVAQRDGLTLAEERPVGAGLDAQAFARTYLVP